MVLANSWAVKQFVISIKKTNLFLGHKLIKREVKLPCSWRQAGLGVLTREQRVEMARRARAARVTFQMIDLNTLFVSMCALRRSP